MLPPDSVLVKLDAKWMLVVVVIYLCGEKKDNDE